jgi:DNA invertase Pin-like site-specific DNA recombinase
VSRSALPDNTPARSRGRLRLVAYLRLSTDRQAERGVGLHVQELAIRAWAKANRHRITLWCRDEGVSGSNGLKTRVALPEALRVLRTGAADALVVYSPDRLARDLVLQEQLLAEIRRMGRQLFTTSAGEAAFLEDDPADPSRKLIRQILGAVAEYERAMIRLRMQAGRDSRRERGDYAGFGSPKYGWRAERCQRGGGVQLVEVESEQVTLARTRDLRAAGSSLRQIAEVLNREGHKTRRSGKPFVRRNKAGKAEEYAPGRWQPQTLSAIIRRLDLP